MVMEDCCRNYHHLKASIRAEIMFGQFVQKFIRNGPVLFCFSGAVRALALALGSDNDSNMINMCIL